jgi:Xaa-Pro dipeptidase
MIDLHAAQKAIREENLGGWLFYNVFHRDEISDLILQVPRGHINTRPWACVVFPDLPPFKLVHAIEPGILDQVPGRSSAYSAREEFTRALENALPRNTPVAAQFSTRFPVSSFFDHGTAMLLERGGARLVSSENLIARCLGTIDERGIASHQKAAKALYAIVRIVWERISKAVTSGKHLREAEVQGWMQALISERGLECDEPPIVAAGAGSADPHYSPRADGALLERGQVIQLDIWAKERAEGSIYADISWIGVLDGEAKPEYKRAFDAVVEAREAAVDLISEYLGAGKPLSGADVDRAARAKLSDAGYARGIRHRTGHSIGGRVHGFGVNLDSVEFPDERTLREGACFSIEPGIYLEDFGMRSEIDGYIHDGKLTVSGGERQRRLLLLD